MTKERKANIMDSTISISNRQGIHYNNYITPIWYGSIIDSQNKLENLKSVYEAYDFGILSIDDFNHSLSEINDNRPLPFSI